jgi:tRNA(Ile)-lysidine synthase
MILGRVRKTVRDRRLIEPGMRVLAACSGGPDSSAMLVALARLAPELGFSLEAASVDHGLRASAAADVDVARGLAAELGLVFHSLEVRVDAKPSLQAAAREARYRALLMRATHIGAARVAIGHTQDDQAETVLLRMLRGAGLVGLAGIDPAREDGVIRPLIDCRRRDVARFAAKHCREVAIDPSNLDARFGRSRVRADVLPGLEREDAAIVQHLADIADDARAVRTALREQAEALLARSIQQDDIIDVSRWGEFAVSVRREALRVWLGRVASSEPSRRQMAEIERALSAPAEVWLAGGFSIESRGDGSLRLARTRGQRSRP